MKLLTQAQFSRKKKVTRARVTQWIHEGRIKLTKGKIDPTTADLDLQRNIDPIKKIILNASKSKRSPKREPPPRNVENGMSYIDVRTAHEVLKSKLTELELQLKRGDLVPKQEALKWLFSIAVTAKIAFWNLPARMRQVLAPISDPNEIYLILKSEIRAIIEEMTKPLPLNQQSEVREVEGPDCEFEKCLASREGARS